MVRDITHNVPWYYTDPTDEAVNRKVGLLAVRYARDRDELVMFLEMFGMLDYPSGDNPRRKRAR